MTLGGWLVVAAFVLAIGVPSIISACQPPATSPDRRRPGACPDAQLVIE
jgi:hypothetical protein